MSKLKCLLKCGQFCLQVSVGCAPGDGSFDVDVKVSPNGALHSF